MPISLNLLNIALMHNTVTKFDQKIKLVYYLVYQNKQILHLQGFWPKTVYHKCFGIQFKTVYLQGPCSSRPCISRPCCNRVSRRRSITSIGDNRFLLNYSCTKHSIYIQTVSSYLIMFASLNMHTTPNFYPD